MAAMNTEAPDRPCYDERIISYAHSRSFLYPRDDIQLYVNTKSSNNRARILFCSKSRDRNSTPATEAVMAAVGRDSFPSPLWRTCRRCAAPNFIPMGNSTPWDPIRRRYGYVPIQSCMTSGENNEISQKEKSR